MNKYTLENALVNHEARSIAILLNHFKLTPNWFNQPLKEPAHLINWASHFYLGKHPRQTLSNEDKSKIASKLKEIHPIARDLLCKEGVYSSRVVRTATIDSYEVYEYLAECYREIECPHCGNSEKFNEEEELDLFEFEHLVGPYYECDNCSKPLRFNSKETDISAINFDHEFMFNGEMQYENVMGLLADYCDDLDQKDFQGFHISGRNLNWRGSNGYAEMTSLDPKELFSLLTVNSDYTLQIDRMFDDTLEVTLCHHDASSGFTVTPGVACEFNGDVLVGEEIELARAYAAIISLLGFYHYEYVSEAAYKEHLGGFTHGLNESVVEIFEELGTNITYTLTENLMKLNEEIENGI